MSNDQDIIKLPFRITEFNEDMLVALDRNFKEIEFRLSLLQRYIKQITGGSVKSIVDAAEIWKRAGAITPDGKFLTEKLDGLIQELQIADQAISELKLKDLAVTSAKLAENSVIMEKIADAAVDASKLADLAVEMSKIAPGAVNSEKIAPGAITAEKIAEGAITADKIPAGEISEAKLKWQTHLIY